VVLPVDIDVLVPVADRRLAASSTLEILDGSLRICVLARRRQRPVENATAHWVNHVGFLSRYERYCTVSRPPCSADRSMASHTSAAR